MKSVFNTLDKRGFIEHLSDDDIKNAVAGKVTLYAGFDPTADSFHLGHLVPIMALNHFHAAGHQVLILFGGATALIGDPAGKSEERPMLTPEEVTENIEGLKSQIQKVIDFRKEPIPKILNNHDWISKVSMIDWLRDVGKNFGMTFMLNKESVKSRIDSQEGISYTEFSYMTLQAYDFFHLSKNYGCTLQCGGSDQWGNITAGIHLIKRKGDLPPAYGLTFPLITTADGKKFGQSEKETAVWLDPGRTSPWDFYQYLVRQDDRDVIRLIKLFTFLSEDEINTLEQSIITAPEKREAQKALAFELTRIVHGEENARLLAQGADVLYEAKTKNVSEEKLAAIFPVVPSCKIKWSEFEKGMDIVGLLKKSGLITGKPKALRWIKEGSIYMNSVQVLSNVKLVRDYLIAGSFIILRVGKKDCCLVCFD